VQALWGDDVDHVYLPYDLPGAVGRFLDHYRPAAALILETELWPNLLFGCRDRGIPTHILNARLSERSLRGYRVLAPLVARALRTVRTVAAQSLADARRFERLGADPARVVDAGNLKFDVHVPDTLAEFSAQCRAHEKAKYERCAHFSESGRPVVCRGHVGQGGMRWSKNRDKSASN